MDSASQPNTVAPAPKNHVPFLLGPVQGLGAFALQRFDTFLAMAIIFIVSLRQLLNLSIFNPAVRGVFLRQFTMTALHALPAIILVGLIVGIITVHAILSLILDFIGAYDTLGMWLSRIMLEEVAPMFTVLIILLRSGTATITDIGLMKIYNELETLRIFGIRLDRYIYLPRLVAFGLAGPCLTFIFSMVALVGGFLLVGYFHNITFDRYVDLLNAGIVPRHIVVSFLKPLLMSVSVAMVSIQRGISVNRTISAIPKALSGGMMLSVGIIILIEICFGMFLSI